MRIGQLIGISLAIIVAVTAGYFVFGVVEVWHDNTGYHTENQPSFKIQEGPGYLKMPAGSVSTIGKEPDAGTRDRAKLLTNPIPPTNDSLAQGKYLFLTYCARCHGKDGNGEGLMGSVPYLGRAPKEEERELSNYLSGYLGFRVDVDLSFVQEESEGEIYHTITNGGTSIMPGYKETMSVEERWHLVNYIKKGLGAGLADSIQAANY